MTQIQTPTQVDASGQGILLPKEPLTSELRRIQVSDIPETETERSRPPSPAFVRNVEEYGILVPIIVAPASQADADRMKGGGRGKYALLGGRRRVLAARAASVMIINAVVFPWGTTPTEAITIIENEQRSDNPLVELEVIEKLVRSGHTLDDICDATGLDRRRAESRMRLSNLTGGLRGLLASGRMAVGVAEEAARLTHEEQGRLFEAAGSAGRITGKEVAAIRKVRARAAVDAMPADMFTGIGDDSEDGPDRPVHMAAGIAPAGLTVALSGPPDALPGFYLSDTEARDVWEVLYFYSRLPPETEALRDRLSKYIQEKEPGRTPARWHPPTPQEPTTPPITGASGKPIKPESQKRQERRERARAAGNTTQETEKQ